MTLFGNWGFANVIKLRWGHPGLLLLLFSHPVVSNSLQPPELQHTRPPCPLPTPRVCTSSCSLHRWCCPAISGSDDLFSCLWSFPASGAFPMSCLFTSATKILELQHQFFQWNSGLISLKIDWFDLLGWPYMAWLIASLSYASPFTMTRQWSMKGHPGLGGSKSNRTGVRQRHTGKTPCDNGGETGVRRAKVGSGLLAVLCKLGRSCSSAFGERMALLSLQFWDL